MGIMQRNFARSAFLLFLAVVFTAGLTFATLELPYYVDGVLQNTIHTPNEDSHVDQVSRIKTELFMGHYHIRSLGYLGFFLLVALIAVGFSTKHTGLAVLGAAGVMLPVFAQFAGVMFFLAGLGVLNALWLPVLDISYELQNWGLVINAPNDFLRWLLGLVGVHSIWPPIIFFIGSGILTFLAGVYAWLSARTRGQGVASAWVYRISRHPQYLGWILWTYGAYILIQRMLYPKRSWGIGASLPWLISTMIIIGVAMLEELSMRRRHGESYDAYRRSAPFLFPVPRIVERFFASPQRLLFKTDQPQRRREVAAVMGGYTIVLIALSAIFYAGGLDATLARFTSEETRARKMESIVDEMKLTANHRQQYRLMTSLAAFGDQAVDPFLSLLEERDPALRALGAEGLERVPAERAVPALCRAATDENEDVRQYANKALAAIGTPETLPCLRSLMSDPADHIRTRALEHLAALGAPEVLELSRQYLENPNGWVRKSGIRALGSLGSARAVPLIATCLNDDTAWVRQEAVIALLRTRSHLARPHLEQALDDPNREVRIYAAEALKRLPTVELPTP